MAKLILHEELFDFDSDFRKSYPLICGVDEAGRGPLAGDIYAAAVVLSDGVLIEGLNDSKKISEKNREKLYDIIIEKADDYCIASASVEEIDSMNILKATMLAMQRAVAGLKIKPDYALIDGNKTPELECPAEFVIKGDARSASIAAASILAKVSRDRYMKQIAALYPQYAFEKHKGYGTKLHYEMILKYGSADVHRKTFLRKLYDEKK